MYIRPAVTNAMVEGSFKDNDFQNGYIFTMQASQ